MGDFEKASEIQEKNVKVLTILGITLEDIRGGKRMLGVRKSSRESLLKDEKSSTYQT